MILDFVKYSATGNDFIVIDNREQKYSSANADLYARLCARRTGIGADGVLFVENSQSEDFSMVYLNADGRAAEMCGNGARAIAHFFAQLTGQKKLRFETKNAVYSAQVSENSVCLTMSELYDLNKYDLSDINALQKLYLNTGVPHVVLVKEEIENLDVVFEGQKIRQDKRFPFGTNVNFVQVLSENKIAVRTYERGVEAETLSCGTGILASAIACTHFFNWKGRIGVKTRGGELSVNKIGEEKSFNLIGDVHEIYRASTQY